MNPAASDHLPGFITAPGQTDTLMVVMIVLLVVGVMALGNVYLRLHALPERMAHRVNHVQLEIIAVLTLLALFTHNSIFWIAALLLAMVQMPNFEIPIRSMAQSLARLSGRHDPTLDPNPDLAPPEDDGIAANPGHKPATAAPAAPATEA